MVCVFLFVAVCVLLLLINKVVCFCGVLCDAVCCVCACLCSKVFVCFDVSYDLMLNGCFMFVCVFVHVFV